MRDLQEALKALGYDPGPLDGVFGAKTESAVKEFQQAREIAADLIVMGTHGHGSVYNLLVGSVTEGILKAAERPVLLVPAPATGK